MASVIIAAMATVAVTGFEALPPALHHHILSFLPLVERVRCALVARSWAAWLADPAFWAELRFDGAAECSVGDYTLLQLCRRAGRHLRLLDVSDPACYGSELESFFEDFLHEGLGRSLETLCTWVPERQWHNNYAHKEEEEEEQQKHCVGDAEEAADLLAACPALVSAAVHVHCNVEDAPATLRTLPVPGRKRVSILEPSLIDDEDDFDVADWAAALAAYCVHELILPDHREWRTALRDEEKAAVLARALAAPVTGVRTLRAPSGWLGSTQLVSRLFGALTADSPLVELRLRGSHTSAAEASVIAAALAPGRSRLQTLDLGKSDLSSSDGGLLLLAALGANTSLTSLQLNRAEIVGASAAATAIATLAASLRSNATLRTLNLTAAELGDGAAEGMRLILLALGGAGGGGGGGGDNSSHQDSRCGLTDLLISKLYLDVPACVALGGSLARGATLESLQMANCNVCPEGAAAVARGIADAGEVSRLRCLQLSWNPIGEQGAAALGQLLAQPACPLESLFLSWSVHTQGDTGGAPLLLEFNPQILRLSVAALARGIEAAGASSRLRDLDLSSNELGDTGAEALGRLLVAQGGGGGALRKLSLGANYIGPKGAKALAGGLRVNSSLEVLELNSNRIGADGVAAIAAGISGADCPSGVRVLLIERNGIGDKSVLKMLRAELGRNTTLKKVEI